MSDSESSRLSSPPATDDELEAPVENIRKTPRKVKRKVDNDVDLDAAEESPARKKRAPSPPHEFVLADNPDIPFIVMFRSRFAECFPSKKGEQLGPQDIERGVADTLPSPQVEDLLCSLLHLVLNRTKIIERGHHGRALEEAIQTQKHQWPRAWGGANPLSGGKNFNTMTAIERLTLLKTLIFWSLHESAKVKDHIKASYKQARQENDLNQPLSVQPWGRDGDKRRYWLVEGKDDTSFRLYRESNPALKNNVWISVANTIEELKLQQDKLEEEGSQAARRLAQGIKAAIPRFEATEEKRKRREYRQARKAQFTRPEPGFSLYEGRTRGKRMKYTFSDEEEETSEAGSGMRSIRQSGRATPADPSRPTITASGRQVRSRQHGAYGESLLSGQTTGDVASPATGDYVHSDASDEAGRLAHGRSTRAAAKPATNGWSKEKKHIETYNSLDELDDEDDASSSSNEWDGGEDADDEVRVKDVSDDDEMSDASDDAEQPRVVTILKYGKGKDLTSSSPAASKDESINLPLQPKSEEAHALPLPSILNPAPATPSPNAYLLTNHNASVNGYGSATMSSSIVPPVAPVAKSVPMPVEPQAFPSAAVTPADQVLPNAAHQAVPQHSSNSTLPPISDIFSNGSVNQQPYRPQEHVYR